MWQRQRPPALLTCAALVVVWYVLAPIRGPFAHEGILSGHDAVVHINYTFKVDRAIHDGQFPVRWVEAYEPGRGQPLFNFYQVGFYYAVEIVHAFTPSLLKAYKLTTVYLWWFAALFMFLALRRHGVLPAAFGAVIFAISPYLIFDTLERSAYPEFAAIAAGAGALWTIDGLLSTGRVFYVPLAGAMMAAMLMSHLPATLILAVFFAFHIAAMWWAGETTGRRFVLLAAAAVLGVALAAFYVIPAIAEQPFVQLHRMAEGKFDFHRYFMVPAQWFDFGWKYGGSIDDPRDYMPLQVGALQWAALVAAALLVIDDIVVRRISNRTIAFGAGLATIAVGLFMSTAASRPVWDLVSPLRFIQFPFRFLMLVPFGSAMLAARLLALVPGARRQAIAVLAIVPLQFLIYRPAMQPEYYASTTLVNPDDPAWPTYPEARRENLEEGYFPSGVTRALAPVEHTWSLRGDGGVREVVATDAHRVVDVDAHNSVDVLLNTPYFPGWTLRVDGATRAPAIREGDAYMQVTVGPGTHRIEATFEETPVRRFANVVSLVGIACTLLVLVYAAAGGVRRRRSTAPPAASRV